MFQNAKTDELIKEIEMLLSDNKIEKALKRCELLFEFKPISLKAINIKAKILIELERYEEVLSVYRYDDIATVAPFQLELIDAEDVDACRLAYKARLNRGGDEYLQRRDENLASFAEQNSHTDSASENLKKSFAKLEAAEKNDRLFELKEAAVIELAKSFFELHRDVEALLCYFALFKNMGANTIEDSIEMAVNLNEKGKTYIFLLNYVMNSNVIGRQILEYDYPIILLKEDDLDMMRMELLTSLLGSAGKDVWLIDLPNVIDVENRAIKYEELNEFSLDSIQVIGNIKIITPIIAMSGSKIIADNSAQLLLTIKGLSDKNFCIVLSADKRADLMMETDALAKAYNRLTMVRSAKLFQNNMVAGYVGNYLEYLSQLFDFDVNEKLSLESETKISVVIPCRNNALTLRYTLMTCLKQNIDDYEIIVSDNSTFGNDEVYKLVKELNSDKIIYIHTPRELPLNRSFEFAYLQAKGEFIFSLGSDDAILFNGLETISKALDMFPNEDIIQWNRGFYIWPGFQIEGQLGQFIIPSIVKESKIIYQYRESIDLMSAVGSAEIPGYVMPMLYINSGFRRKYLQKLFDATGRLIDGAGQDLYTGCVTLALNNKILYLDNGITLAGMSNSSTGLTASKANQTQLAASIENSKGNGQATISGKDRLFASSDLIGIVHGFIKIKRMKINERWVDGLLDMKKILKIVVATLDIEDDSYESAIKSLLNFVYINNRELYEWFSNELINEIKVIQVTKQLEEKHEQLKKNLVYQEGIAENGWRTLDSRKFNINNIYEACEFIDDIM